MRMVLRNTEPEETAMNLAEQLEEIIDSHGITNVLEAIEQVCYEKAEHVQSNWQDRPLAKAWEKVATKLGVAIVASRNIPQ
jgi:hypothetical protein